MVKLIKKPPVYAGMVPVCAYQDESGGQEPWIQVAIDATQDQYDGDPGTMGYVPDDNYYTGSGPSARQIREKIAEEVVPPVASGTVSAGMGSRGGFWGAVGGFCAGVVAYYVVEVIVPPIQDAIEGSGADAPETETDEDNKQKSTTN